MHPAARIIPLLAPDGFEALCAEAVGEGFRFMDRLAAEWRSGANQFGRTGEILLGAFRAGELVAVGGLNRDPYADRDGVGRLRHLYVKRSDRRSGVGAALVRQLLAHAEGGFHCVRLRAQTQEAAAFYVSLGFRPVQESAASHVFSLRD